MIQKKRRSNTKEGGYMYALIPMHTETKRAWYVDTSEFYLDVEIENSKLSIFAKNRRNGEESFVEVTPEETRVKEMNARLLDALKHLADPALVSKGGANMDKRFEEARALIKEMSQK